MLFATCCSGVTQYALCLIGVVSMCECCALLQTPSFIFTLNLNIYLYWLVLLLECLSSFCKSFQIKLCSKCVNVNFPSYKVAYQSIVHLVINVWIGVLNLLQFCDKWRQKVDLKCRCCQQLCVTAHWHYLSLFFCCFTVFTVEYKWSDHSHCTHVLCGFCVEARGSTKHSNGYRWQMHWLRCEYSLRFITDGIPTNLTIFRLAVNAPPYCLMETSQK